jgi:two-component system chemotaxis response regulator CheY
MNKVLIIDDDEFMLNVLSKQLEDDGYTLLSTADGPHGIELYKKEKPDIVLLDIGLPTISGIEVLKQIKQFDADAKIIMITGYPSSLMKEEAMRNGAFAFYEKPGVIRMLKNVTKNALASQVS